MGVASGDCVINLTLDVGRGGEARSVRQTRMTGSQLPLTSEGKSPGTQAGWWLWPDQNLLEFTISEA